ncbi:MAG: GNAT family N-acetyltransferase [Planctomycetes bacterium]|nr:GNAT family N-acetyltransferase [Planctomycetota bacterium]
MPEAKDWKTQFHDRIASARAAVGEIRSGNRIFIGTGCGVPKTLVEALVNEARHLADCDIYHLLTIGDAPYAQARYRDRFRLHTFFISDNVREAVREGAADYIPICLSDIPDEFDSGRCPLDVALIQVSPPDSNGLMSLGVSVDIVRTAAENARMVIAEVNEQTPRTCGNSLIHVNDVDHLVPADYPLPEYHIPKPDETIRRIGQYVAQLVDDGCTLEIGIGTVSQSVLEFLKDKKDLGIHTEMFTDSLVDLIKAGVITCSKKSVDRGKVVVSFCMGTQRLYEFIHNNLFIEFHPTSYVNDPFLISRHHKMVGINMALQVDLTGQICSDSVGHEFYSGFGGQIDFIRGAARARGGKPIIALPSTAKGETISRIVPTLSQGAGVVVTRGDVHYVVTEYGIAYLHGKSVMERALSLINIAHPKFRNELLKEAKRLRFVREEQIELPWESMEYPESLQRTHVLKDGTQVLFRSIKTTDDRSLKDLFYSLSQESIYYRFFQPLKELTFSKRQPFVSIDYTRELALVGVVEDPGGDQIVAVGRYARDPKSRAAEVAFLVRDDWQNLGIGHYLFQTLAEIARSKRIDTFQASVLASNHAMLRVFQASGFDLKMHREDEVYEIEVDLTPRKEKV